MYLYATLPTEQIAVLKRIIQNATAVKSISPKNLFYELQVNGTSSVYFSPLKQLFNYLFGNYSQTILADNGHLLIGN